MSQSKRGKLVEWSLLHKDQFLLASSDLRLYQINSEKQAEQSKDAKQNTSPVKVVSICAEVQNIRCVAWNPLLSTIKPKDHSALSLNENINNKLLHETSLMSNTELAVGLANGKMVLLSISNGIPQIIKEFTPHTPRNCNAISWNTNNPQLIAVGLDKGKDQSLIIWDINKSANIMPTSTTKRLRSDLNYSTGNSIVSNFANKLRGKEEESSFFDIFNVHHSASNPTLPVSTSESHHLSSTESGVLQKFSVVPLIDGIENVKNPYLYIPSDSTQAISWVPNMPLCLITICQFRQIKVFDLRRDTTQPKTVISLPRQVSGLTFDPYHPDRFLTYSENSVNIWDLRKMNTPVLTINTGATVTQASWCPTQSGIIGTLSGKDEQTVRFWEINESFNHNGSNNNNLNANYSDFSSSQPLLTLSPHLRTFHSEAPISSFSWHPTRHYQLLTMSDVGMAELVELHDNIPFAWSPFSSLTFPASNCFKVADLEESNDISKLMIERAKAGYSYDFEDNYHLTLSKPQLFPATITRLFDWMRTIQPISPRFQGIQSLLRSSDSPSRVKSLAKMIGDQHDKQSSSKNYLFPPIYESQQRKTVFRICRWSCFDPWEDKKNPGGNNGSGGVDDSKSAEVSFEDAIQSMEKKKQFQRAAAISVFHFNIPRAISTLKTGFYITTDMKMQLVAMMLSGFMEVKEDPTAINNWKLACRDILSQTDSHPYLKALFSFLCTDHSANYQTILNNNELSLLDRIAFACRFLPDQLLMNYIDHVAKIVITTGELEGLAITGLSEDGVSLLQTYIDATSDIQTASLVMSHVVPSRFRDIRVQKWVYLYRQMLDQWELWSQRALFDLCLSDFDKKPSQVYARCNYCNYSLSLNTQSRMKVSSFRNRAQPKEKLKVTGCPNCNRPLPRCSVCLLFLNCHLPDRSISVRDEDLKLQDGSKFAEWFTWCQTCKHGGHSEHIIEWFSNHSECPVVDCHCNCNEI